MSRAVHKVGYDERQDLDLLLTPFYKFGSYLQVTPSTVFHCQTWSLWALATSQ